MWGSPCHVENRRRVLFKGLFYLVSHLCSLMCAILPILKNNVYNTQHFCC